MNQISPSAAASKELKIARDKNNTLFESNYTRAQNLAKNPHAQHRHDTALSQIIDELKTLRPFVNQTVDLEQCKKLDRMMAGISNRLTQIEKTLEWENRTPLAGA